MQINWEAVLASLGISGLALGAISYVAKSILQQWLSARLDAHKNQLRYESELELERLRTDLHKEAFEHQVRFSRLHDRRAEVIAEVYARLDRLHLAFRRWASLMKPGNVDMKQLADDAAIAFNEFTDYYYPHAIWLTEETCESINRIVSKLHEIYVDISFDVDEKGFPRDKRLWLDSYKKLNEEVPQARRLLDKKFRALLGMEDSETGSEERRNDT